MAYDHNEHMDDAEFLHLFFPDLATSDNHADIESDKANYLVRSAAYATFRLKKYRYLANHCAEGLTPDQVKKGFEAFYNSSDIDQLIDTYDKALVETTDDYGHKLIAEGLRENAGYRSIQTALKEIVYRLRKSEDKWENIKHSLFMGIITTITLAVLTTLLVVVLSVVFNDKPWAILFRSMLDENSQIVRQEDGANGDIIIRITSPD